VCLYGVEDVVIGDEKVRVPAIAGAGLVIKAVHVEEYRFLDVVRRAQLRDQMGEIG